MPLDWVEFSLSTYCQRGNLITQFNIKNKTCLKNGKRKEDSQSMSRGQPDERATSASLGGWDASVASSKVKQHSSASSATSSSKTHPSLILGVKRNPIIL
jgi:hypothetical protein